MVQARLVTDPSHSLVLQTKECNLAVAVGEKYFNPKFFCHTYIALCEKLFKPITLNFLSMVTITFSGSVHTTSFCLYCTENDMKSKVLLHGCFALVETGKLVWAKEKIFGKLCGGQHWKKQQLLDAAKHSSTIETMY